MTTNGIPTPLPTAITTRPAWTSQTVRAKCGSSTRRYAASCRVRFQDIGVELEAGIAGVRMAETFVISRGASDEAEVVDVEIRHEGVSGLGEAAPIERYSESAESAQAFALEAADLLREDTVAFE